MFLKRGSDQCIACRKAVSIKTVRHRETAQVQQVHEIRVETHVFIQDYGIGLSFSNRIDRTGCRNNQHIDITLGFPCNFLQSFNLVDSLKSV